MKEKIDIEKLLVKEARLIDREIEKVLPKEPHKKWLDFIASKPEFCYDLESLRDSITIPLWDFLSRGGKRWRPFLLLLSCEAVGGNPKDFLSFTILPELAHNGSIIVDDIEDNSTIRRGKPTLHLIYGQDIAINAGNSIYFLPLKIIEDAIDKKLIDKDKAVEIYMVYTEEMIRLSLGQAMDILWHRKKISNITEEQYLQMCTYKTGSLAKMSAKIGAILGDASREQIVALGNFAASIGVAFQIQDDILNIKPSEKWGKEFGDDISEGKKTLMVIYTLKNTEEKKANKLLEILNMHTKDKRLISEAVSIIDECGAIEYAKNKAKEIVKNSWQKVDACLEESKAKHKLEAFANFLVDRNI
ncbi:MAG: polyprenyl synthetase family protein [Candidatus Diapherotrites archaeon]|nr:polyprenyl synthetase family protein [Candidatus Diapherotrites archaeon]